MRKSPKYLITGVLACILIVIIVISYKNSVIKENISNIKSIEKPIKNNLKKITSSDKILKKPFVKTIIKQAKKNKNIFDSKAVTFTSHELTEREKYEQFLMNHPFSNRNRIYNNDSSERNEKVESEESKEQETPRLAYEQDFLRTMNPALQRPTPEVLQGIMFNNAVKQFSSALLGLPGAGEYSSWISRGPSNVGGRTRSIAWDPNDVSRKKVWAGSVSGGLWYNNDITNGNSQWLPVSDMWSNFAITKIVFDPNNSQIMYVATGEVYTGASLTIGAGIWKSVNGGLNWTKLSSTDFMTFINDMAIRTELGNSVIYVAVDRKETYGEIKGARGLKKSSDGGETWTEVMKTNGTIDGNPIPFVISSISIGADNRIYVGTKNYETNVGLSDKGGGKILFSDDGSNWDLVDLYNTTTGSGRVTVATAPSNANYVYAFIEKGVIPAVNNNPEDLNNPNHITLSDISILKSTDKGDTWYVCGKPHDAETVTINTADFTRNQAGYDQMLKVDPNNPQILYIGGIDLFKSTDEGSNWTQISKWINEFGMANLPYSLVHADQHVMEFKPGSSTTAIFGNDGGVYYSNNLANASTNDVFVKRNNFYNVTQFYAAAMHPSAGRNYFLAGAQDNGNLKFTLSGVSSEDKANDYGDGAYCFIDQSNPFLQIVSAPNNTIAISTDAGNSFTNAPLQQETLQFINPACYDNNSHIYYSDGLYSDINNNLVFGYI